MCRAFMVAFGKLFAEFRILTWQRLLVVSKTIRKCLIKEKMRIKVLKNLITMMHLLKFGSIRVYVPTRPLFGEGDS